MPQDRNVLSAIGLGLNAPKWGWPPGIGLRWTLPVATTIHDPAVNLRGQPRGWPPEGFQIYRAKATSVVNTVWASTGQMQVETTEPLALGETGVTIDWAL